MLFATAILGACIQLPFDGEGRIMLPEQLILSAGLKDKAAFVGKGTTFEIWSPEPYQEYSIQAREIAKKEREIFRIKSKIVEEGKKG